MKVLTWNDVQFSAVDFSELGHEENYILINPQAIDVEKLTKFLNTYKNERHNVWVCTNPSKDEYAVFLTEEGAENFKKFNRSTTVCKQQLTVLNIADMTGDLDILIKMTKHSKDIDFYK